jgi:penicillin-binding protein 2
MKDSPDLFRGTPFNKLFKNLRGKYKLSWVENSLDIEQSSASQLTIPHTRRYIGTIIEKNRLLYFLFFILCCIGILIGQIFNLQIIQGDHFRALAENNRLRILPIAAERGIIYDRFNKELVQNVPNFFLSIVPQSLPNKKTDPLKRAAVIQRVAEISGVPEQEINKKLDRYSAVTYQSLRIKENLDYTSALNLYLKNSDLPGILIEYGSKRNYINTFSLASTSTTSSSASSFSHLLGYLGKLDDQEWNTLKINPNYLPSDDIGKTGLEKTYETELRGTYGRKKIEVDALEREQNVLAIEPPIPGKNLILSIDAEAQIKLEQLIKKQLEKLHKDKASGIAINPETGKILALVSYPFFNNNDFSGGINQKKYTGYTEDKNHPLFNRAIAGLYPAGSTLKLVVAAAALQEKIITSATTFNSTGGIQIDRWFFPDWKAGGHGLTNVTKALAWSVNTFFYYIGGGYGDFKGMGVDVLVKYFELFNLGKKTNIDLPGESAGFVPSRIWKEKERSEQWFIGDTYNISIGQGDTTVTPLQVALWTAAIANGGNIMKPTLVDKIIDPITKQEIFVSSTIQNKNFISSENIEIVKQGMGECVKVGSCKMLQNLPFQTGGKTGTAQWNKNRDTHAWFTSFAPYNHPQIVVTVLVEEGGEGASAAMPIVDEFLKWWGNKYLTQNAM